MALPPWICSDEAKIASSSSTSFSLASKNTFLLFLKQVQRIQDFDASQEVRCEKTNLR
jgi:hypothetical protein